MIGSKRYVDDTFGWEVIELTCGNTSVGFVPEKGCNITSWKVDGVEYMFAGMVRDEKPFVLGTPILFPTPNRVRNAQFTFDDETFQFEANNGTNFLHGLVREEPWDVEEPVVADDNISVKASISFEPGKSWFEVFPVMCKLTLTYTVTEGNVRIAFTVDNLDESKRLPFGLAIHPYFQIIGERKDVRLQVPCTKWQEVVELLPTGKLLDLADGPADLNEPVALENLDLDDVFWGLEESKPQVIYYDKIGKKVVLTAPDFYKLSVIFTPTRAPFFCVENQSCSTDAHNMYAQGNTELAQLAILDPGKSHESWIELALLDQ